MAIEIDGFPIKNCDFPINNGDFPIKNCDFPIKNGDFPIKTGGSFQFANCSSLPGRVPIYLGASGRKKITGAPDRIPRAAPCKPTSEAE